jgi:seryl-tRNA synthetase
LKNRGEESSIQEILKYDDTRRKNIVENDELKRQRNEVSKSIGSRRSKGEFVNESELELMKEVGTKIANLDNEIKDIEFNMHELLSRVPNIPESDVPIGKDESDNPVIRQHGEKPKFSFDLESHWDIGERLDIIDLPRGAKLSGSRFYTLKGLGSKLERALIAWMLDYHTNKHNYTEVSVPYLVRQEIIYGSGNLPKFGDNLYHDTEDDLWLIPTAEVPITGLHKDEILELSELPKYYVAHTPCFRREQAAAGRDTRGIKRVHQFNKVEMYKIVDPETSDHELETLLSNAEDICEELGLTYRIVQLCTGDISFVSAKSFDIEIWAAGCEEWLEVSTCSNCTDFQARRTSLRYRPDTNSKPQFVHTLNGSGLAIPRVMIAILENYQQSDGSIVIPEILRPYTGFDRIGPTEL